MHFILTPIGSAGDVHPFIGLGRELMRRGHRVTVFTNDYFKEIVLKTGLEFDASSSSADFERTASDPRLWHPTRAFSFLAKEFFLPLTPILDEYIRKNHGPGRAVVSSTLSWGARCAQEKAGIPNVTVHLQPSVMISVDETAVYGGLDWISGAPRWLRQGYAALASASTDAPVVKDLNRYRRSIGLGPVKGVFTEWCHSPLLALGLFPEWFAPPQPDWPKQVKLAGFPLHDVEDVQTMPPALEKFLNDGPPPVVFTAGSAMKQARLIFEAAAEVCRRVGCRAVIVNRFADQIPSPLPPNVVWTEWAPFPLLLPRAAAVQHHGGIGTTAQSLKAGVPQLVTPFAHDQFDNAARVRRLGAGETLLPKKYKVPAVEAALRRLLGDAGMKERCREIAARLDGPTAIARACDLILEACHG